MRDCLEGWRAAQRGCAHICMPDVKEAYMAQGEASAATLGGLGLPLSKTAGGMIKGGRSISIRCLMPVGWSQLV